MNIECKKLTLEDLKNIDKTSYITWLNNLTKEIEERVKIKITNKTTYNGYIKLLKDIKIKIQEMETSSLFEIDSIKINFINSLIELRDNLYTLTLSEKTEIFMKYVETNDLPAYKSDIKFCDIDTTTTYNLYIENWFKTQIYMNLKKFKPEVERYKDTYPNAYQKISERIDKLPKTKSITTSFRTKVEIFMEILENDMLSLPIKNDNLTFNDFTTKINSKSKIKLWLHNVLINEKDNFILVCSENKEVFPKGYKKITEYIDPNKNIRLDTNTRIKIWLKYLETNPMPQTSSKITFNDIESNCLDHTLVMHWVYLQLNTNQDEFLEYLEKYQTKYQTGYKKAQDRISKFLTYRTKNDLTSSEKIEIFMKYINQNEIPTSTDNISFKDITENTFCDHLIYPWLMQNILVNRKNINELIYKYQEKYPIACQRLSKRMNKLEDYRKEFPIRIKFPDKVKIFMEYIEENDIPTDASKIKFCDCITYQNIEDKTIVGSWFRDQMKKNLYRFSIEINKYQHIYPKAYNKIVNRINNSTHRVDRHRKLLINVLTQIEYELKDCKTKKYNKIK